MTYPRHQSHQDHPPYFASVGTELSQAFPELDPIESLTELHTQHWVETYLLEQTVEVNVNHIATVRIEQNILAVPVSKPAIRGQHAIRGGKPT